MALRTKLKKLGIPSYRKWTFPIHVLFGFFLAGIPPASIYLAHIFQLSTIAMFALGVFLSLALLVLFAWDEWWDDYCNRTHEGESDWWAAFASYVTGWVAFLAVAIVHGVLAGVSFW